MSIIIGKSEHILEDTNDLHKLKKGGDGTTYEFGDMVLKILHKDHQFMTRKDACFYIKNCNTKRILHPTKLITNEFGEYIGYITPNKLKKYKRLTSYKCSHFLENISLLEEDFLVYLPTIFTRVYDVSNPSNYIYSEDLHICDMDRYQTIYNFFTKCFKARSTIQSIEKYNLRMWNNSLCNLIRFEMIGGKSIYEVTSETRAIDAWCKEQSEETDIVKYMTQELAHYNDETLECYFNEKIPHLVRKYNN